MRDELLTERLFFGLDRARHKVAGPQHAPAAVIIGYPTP